MAKKGKKTSRLDEDFKKTKAEQIEISGYFRKRFEEVFYHLLSDLSAEDIVTTLKKCKEGLHTIPQNQVFIRDRAIDAMMTLMSEINYQAAKQEKTVATDKFVNESISDLLNDTEKMDPIVENVEKLKKVKDKSIDEVIKFTKNNNSLSTEDSSQ